MGQVIHELLTVLKDEEMLDAEKEYLAYLDDHISNVKKAYKIYFIPLLSTHLPLI